MLQLKFSLLFSPGPWAPVDCPGSSQSVFLSIPATDNYLIFSSYAQNLIHISGRNLQQIFREDLFFLSTTLHNERGGKTGGEKTCFGLGKRTRLAKKSTLKRSKLA